MNNKLVRRNMHWKSNEQIATYFDLRDSDDIEPKALSQAITIKMASIHPDTNGGEWADLDSKELWNELQSAKAFVETANADSNNQLIPVSQVTTLVESITQGALQPLESRISHLKSEAREDARFRGSLPRVGSGVFAAICGFLFTFASSAKDHPLLGEWLQTWSAQMVLLVGLTYSGMFFFMTWFRERRQEFHVEFLSSEEGLRRTLASLIKKCSRNEEHPRRFTLRELTEELRPSRHRDSVSPFLILFGGETISRSIADKIAALHLERMTKRGVIIELPHKNLDRRFEISRASYSEIRDHGTH